MENNLESYLAQIEAQLTDVPAARKAEFMDEARAHLWALCQAKRADGLDVEAAWLQAAAEFGAPAQVGRELRAQWASSGQLETEGAPLSSRRKIGVFVLPVVVCVVVYTIFTLMQASTIEMGWQVLVLASVAFGSFIYGVASDVRKRGGWKASTVVCAMSTPLILANALLDMSGKNAGNSLLRSQIVFALITLSTLLYFWLYKRERANRPWQWSALYKTNPVAAEQQYRLGPIVGLAMGNVLGCIGMISMGLQFFGLPIALLSCAGLISVSIVLGRWLVK